MNGESLPRPDAPTPRRWPVRERLLTWFAGLKAYFTEQDPKFMTAFAPAFVVSVLMVALSLSSVA